MIYTETFPTTAVARHPAACNLVYSITSSARASSMAWYFESTHVSGPPQDAPKRLGPGVPGRHAQ